MTTEAFALSPGTLLSRKDAADYVRETWGRPCSIGLLNKLAVTGGGPAFRKIGGRWIVYEKQELDRWATAEISAPVSSTADAREKGVASGRPGPGRRRAAAGGAR